MSTRAGEYKWGPVVDARVELCMTPRARFPVKLAWEDVDAANCVELLLDAHGATHPFDFRLCECDSFVALTLDAQAPFDDLSCLMI